MLQGGYVSFDSSPEPVVDYRDYNFRAVWTGRGDVDRFEQALFRVALDRLDLRRTLEIGTGFGRLTPQILGRRGEYVGVDYDLGGLGETRESVLKFGLQNAHSAWLAANAYHLPFGSGSFSSACMVRVHHHLANPARAIKEIARVLVPGGTALITYSDRTWTRSLVHDLGLALRRADVANDRRLLFAREGHLQVREMPTRQFMTTPAQFAKDLSAAGLDPVCSYGGADTTAARLMPLRLGVWGGRLWPGAPVFSARWVVVRKRGAPNPLRTWNEIIACPRCTAPGPALDGEPTSPVSCPHCGFLYRWEHDLLDARDVVDPNPATAGGERPPEDAAEHRIGAAPSGNVSDEGPWDDARAAGLQGGDPPRATARSP
jgi:ubiquinone/menaquinone biosynthesis C-methylase UbiE